MAELSTGNVSTCDGFRQDSDVKPKLGRSTEPSLVPVGSRDIYALTLIVL